MQISLFLVFKSSEKVSEYDLGNTTLINCIQTQDTARKSHTKITRHQEDKLGNSVSSLFPIKIIAKLEWT